MIAQARYDVFLSYNSADEEAVGSIARRLREEARLCPFLDRWHLIPGEPWQEAIEEALEQSETMAVFVGPSGISPWHNEEMRAGLDRAVRGRDDVRVIPVLLPGTDPKCLPSFLTRRTCADFRAGLDDDDAFTRLVAGILGQPPEQAGAFTLPDEPAPYPGLRPFTARQAGFFFGRTDERDRLLEQARESSFVAVVGASGSGKSSLVLAGLLPALDEGWHTLVLVPGAQPMRALADQLATLVPPADRLRLSDDLEARLMDRPNGLSTAISTLLAGRPDVATLLIVVDQFEELFTQGTGTPEEVRRQQCQFIANLVDAVHTSGGRVRVMLTLRADFVRHCLEFPDLCALLEANQMLLGPMGEGALREAIVKPAQAVGAMFERGLVARVVGDTRDQSVALPLMQSALAQLWQRRHGVWLTHAAYEAIGGVGGAIDQRADAVYCQLSEKQQCLARNLFMRLVTVDDGTGPTRRRVSRDELKLAGAAAEEVEILIGILTHRDVRLIAADADTVELAHEALIDQWERLRGWLDADRAGMLMHRRLTEIAHEWDKRGRDPSYLYRGTRLAATKQWADTHGDELNLLEYEFLKSSLSAWRRVCAQRVSAGVVAAVLIVGVLVAMITECGPFAPRMDWSPVPDFAEMEVSSLTWGTDGTMYVGLGEGAYPSSVARSRDSGTTWEFLDLEGNFVWSLLPDPYRADVIYVSLGTDGLFWSQDGGDNWTPIGNGLPMSEVDALAVSPAGVLYAGDFTAPTGVYASRDQGETWYPLQGSPKRPVFYLDWTDDRLLVGTEQGLWQWTADGQWVCLLDEPMPIYSVVSAEGVLFAGGEDGIYELREGADPRKISPEEVFNIDVTAGDAPRFVAGTIDGSVLQWRLDAAQVDVVAHSTDLSGASYIYVIRAQLDGPVSYWAGTENGLHCAEMRRWFEVRRE